MPAAPSLPSARSNARTPPPPSHQTWMGPLVATTPEWPAARQKGDVKWAATLAQSPHHVSVLACFFCCSAGSAARRS